MYYNVSASKSSPIMDYCESREQAIQHVIDAGYATAVIWEVETDHLYSPILLWHKNVLYEIGNEVPS